MVRLETSLVLLTAMVVAGSMEFHGSAATEHVVGDSFGWHVPPNVGYYDMWSSRQTFKINDVIVFNFTSGLHTAAEVTKDAYNNCDSRNPISLKTTSPARFTINTAKDHYYICTGGEAGQHCRSSQKFAIRVSRMANMKPSH